MQDSVFYAKVAGTIISRYSLRNVNVNFVYFIIQSIGKITLVERAWLSEKSKLSNIFPIKSHLICPGLRC